MAQCTRRDAMICIGVGAAGLVTNRTLSWAIAPRTVDRVGDLAELFRTTPEADVFDVCVKSIQAGADYKAILTAVFVAGIHDIQPRPVGSKLHAVMMVESAFQLAEAGSKCDAYHAALWSLHDFKRYQQRDRNEGDWVLPQNPKVSRLGADAARGDFLAAMETWDAGRADRGLVALLRHVHPESVFELLWPFMARSFVDFGHKIIFGVQVERVLRRVGWRHAEPALRSLVNGLTYSGPGVQDTVGFDRAKELAASFPADWERNSENPQESDSLLKGLRNCDSAGAQQLVVAALNDGVGATAVWDGLRLFASELFLRRPPSSTRRHLPVHPVTEVNAFGHASRATSNDSTKRLLILQAAAWLPLWKPVLTDRFEPLANRPGIDALGGDRPVQGHRIDETFEQRSPDDTRVFLDQGDGQRINYLSWLRGFLFRKAWQDHQYKYLAAISEESRLVNPKWASRLLAPAITYLPTQADDDSEVARRANHTLQKSGVC